MEKIENFDVSKIAAWDVVLAVSTVDMCCDWDRMILLDGSDYIREHDSKKYEYDNQWIILQASHCSCFDMKDSDWEAMLYTRDELIKLATAWNNGSREIEDLMSKQILYYWNLE